VFINVYTSRSSFIFQCDQPIAEIESRKKLSGKDIAHEDSDDEPSDARNNGEEGDTRSCSSSVEDEEDGADVADEDADDEDDQGAEAADVEEHSSNSDNDEDEANIREENDELITRVIDNSRESQTRYPENGDGSRPSSNGDVGMQQQGLGQIRSNGGAADIGDLRHKLFACITTNAGTNDRSGQSSGNEGANGNQIEG
jgi:hypothetical protein